MGAPHMVEESDDVKGFNWRLLLYAAALALIAFTAISICDADVSLFLYLFFVGPLLIICSMCLVIFVAFRKTRRRYLPLIPVLFALWVISGSFFVYDIKNPIAIRSAVRWLIWSREYKDEVFAQPADRNGEFKHIEWDGWGMFAQNTSVYLVFDPTDSLAPAARNHRPGKFVGIPCEVYQVRRLETLWYSVIAYTSEPWGECN